jgi:hypothetical protein
MTALSTVQVPSAGALARATVVALLAGTVVLVTAVLPAEYGIDPTGVGRAVGLLDLYAAEAVGVDPGPAVTPAPEGPVFARADDYRTDSRRLTVGPYGTVEFKYELGERAAMVYVWTATEELSYDFHTEPAANPEASETYERGAASVLRGAYVAPYAGIHGWYWRNNTERDVTITLMSSGFYTSARLFQDGGAGQDVPLRGADPTTRPDSAP